VSKSRDAQHLERLFEIHGKPTLIRDKGRKFIAGRRLLD